MNHQFNKLPYAVSFSKTDSPVYILNRLAEIHGYTSTESMVKASGFRITSKKEQRLNGYSLVFNSLTGQSVIWRENSGFEHNKDRYFKSLVADSYKLCIDCSKQSKSPMYHRYITTSHCIEHNCKLIDSCENCGSSIELGEMTNYGCCSFCSGTFNVEHSPIPAYQKHLFALKDKERNNFLFDLCMAAGFVLRPYDSNPSQVRINQIKDWELLFTQAYELLKSESVAYTWFLQNSDIRALQLPNLGEAGSLAGFDNFRKKRVYNWSHEKFDNISTKPENFPDTNELDSSHFLSHRPLALKPLAEAEFNEYSRYQVDPCQMSDILGFDLSVILTLSKIDVLVSASKTNAYVHNQFDLREIDKLIGKTSKNCDGLERIPFDLRSKSLEQYIDLFDLNIAYILSLAFTNSQKCFISKNMGKLSEKIHCQKIALLKHLSMHFKLDSERNRIESDAMKLYGLSKLDLIELKKHDILHPQPYNRRHVYYKSKHLQMLDKTFFCLGRYCKLRGLEFKEIKSQLSKSGIHPIIGSSIYQCRYQIIRYLKFNEIVDPVNILEIKEKHSVMFSTRSKSN